eukprot:UN27570
MHSKLWRPSILLLLDDVDHALIDFCNQLKKGGLYVIGNALVGDFEDLAEPSHKIRREWIHWIDSHGYKAFPHVAIGPSLRVCWQNLMLLAGLGAMTPNTIVISPWRKLNTPQTDKNPLVFTRRTSAMKDVDEKYNKKLPKENLFRNLIGYKQ